MTIPQTPSGKVRESSTTPVRFAIRPATRPSDSCPYEASYRVPPYFSGERQDESKVLDLCQENKDSEARELIGDGSLASLERLVDYATRTVTEIFHVLSKKPESVEGALDAGKHTVASLHLSPALEAWRAAELAAGRALPAKGHGLRRVSDTIIARLGAEAWPEPLLTGNTLFGSGWAAMLAGAYDAPTLYSNYVVDVAFYLEHGFSRAFPGFERLLQDAGFRDSHALSTPGGREHRWGAMAGLGYIRAKCALEEYYAVAETRFVTARFCSRRAAQIVFFAESSMLGVAAEAISRGFDPATVFADLVFSNPGTDVVDVGSDLLNSELCNSLLSTDDIAGAPWGEVTEEALGHVYDAYAHVGARVLGGTRWAEQTAAMNVQLLIWHILNGRHFFLRRCVLGHAKMLQSRKSPQRAHGQREASFEEAFDERLHTTGFSRSLATACDGAEPRCDKVESFLAVSSGREYLVGLWDMLAAQPLAYARAETVDPDWEENFCERLGCALAETYARGLVREMAWMSAHATHHSWQVNYLMEAAMWGSFLDDGGLNGRLDRFESEKDAS